MTLCVCVCVRVFVRVYIRENLCVRAIRAFVRETEGEGGTRERERDLRMAALRGEMEPERVVAITLAPPFINSFIHSVTECCSVFQCVAVCCRVLQCVAVAAIMSASLFGNSLIHSAAECCSVLQSYPSR